MGVIAWRLKWLTFSGGCSAVLAGFIIYRFLGIGGWVILMMFFITATILGKLSRTIMRNVGSDLQKKGGTRDWLQVLANGGIATTAALFSGFGGGTLALVAFGAALAASTADTWAGEAGILSKKSPVSILTFRPVPTGMSGGVSLLGTVSSLLGSSMIALAWYATFANYSDENWMFLASVVAVSGIIGSLVDSYLGATIQGHYYDPDRDQITEHEERDGKKLALCRGVRWIDNDVVNLMSNTIAVLLALGFSLIFL